MDKMTIKEFETESNVDVIKHILGDLKQNN